MKTRVRQIDKDKWIVEAFDNFLWKACCFPLKTKEDAESFALYHSKSEVVHSEFENGKKIK